MSQERNQQRHCTLHFIPAHSELYAVHRYTRAVSCLNFQQLSFYLGKGFQSRLNTANIARNEKQDYHSNALCLPKKKGDSAVDGCESSTKAPASISIVSALWVFPVVSQETLGRMTI